MNIADKSLWELEILQAIVGYDMKRTLDKEAYNEKGKFLSLIEDRMEELFEEIE